MPEIISFYKTVRARYSGLVIIFPSESRVSLQEKLFYYSKCKEYKIQKLWLRTQHWGKYREI